MSGISVRQRWDRTVECGWGLEDLYHIGICQRGRLLVCEGGRGPDDILFPV